MRREGFGREVLARFRPVVVSNEVLDVSEVEANDHRLSNLPVAKATVHLGVQEAVVLGRCLIAHSAEHADCLLMKWSRNCWFLWGLTPAFAAGLERSGKPVRQHALVILHIPLPFQHE